MKITDEMREYLADKYDCDSYNEIEAESDGSNDHIHITGIMPNTNQLGKWYAGTAPDIQKIMDSDNRNN